MKNPIKRAAALLLLLLLLLGCMSVTALGASAASPDALTILFTHDTHDHFLPAAKESGGEYGGYTRLATLIKTQRAKAENPIITVDAGDFSMGTLFQTIYATHAPELRALGAMGYDATTLGNHEFDYRAQGLIDMLSAATRSGDPLPKLVQANYKPPESDTATRAALENFGVTDYTILTKGTVRVAVFGVMGVDADECAPMSGMELEPMADAAKRVVAAIEASEKPDYIICLSHGGTSKDPKKSEDELLAKAVPGIDVIISGHTHATLAEPIRVGETLIVSAGAYTTNLGVLTVQKRDGVLTASNYQLLPVNETVEDDADMAALAQSFKPPVEREYLSNFGMTFDQVLATTPFSFTPISKFATQQAEDTLGNLITDAYLYAVQQAEGTDYIPVDFAVVVSGVVRGSFAEGEISLSNAFNVSSLGSGGDGTPGYPLISAWLTGKELKDAFEVDASVTPLMPAAQLYGSGMEWTFNPHRILFNKVTDCKQVMPDGSKKNLENGKLYRCVTGLFSGQMLGAVNSKSFGILSITPKDAAGKPVTDF
ncbi:MAG: 5'-nucleotidase C-terminal domain-containing protein, partial [Oscillospiraceae bacterium]